MSRKVADAAWVFVLISIGAILYADIVVKTDIISDPRFYYSVFQNGSSLSFSAYSKYILAVSGKFEPLLYWYYKVVLPHDLSFFWFCVANFLTLFGGFVLFHKANGKYHYNYLTLFVILILFWYPSYEVVLWYWRSVIAMICALSAVVVFIKGGGKYWLVISALALFIHYSAIIVTIFAGMYVITNKVFLRHFTLKLRFLFLYIAAACAGLAYGVLKTLIASKGGEWESGSHVALVVFVYFFCLSNLFFYFVYVNLDRFNESQKQVILFLSFVIIVANGVCLIAGRGQQDILRIMQIAYMVFPMLFIATIDKVSSGYRYFLNALVFIGTVPTLYSMLGNLV